MYKKVLIPLDGSPFAERILPHIEWLVSPKETELVLVRVVESPQRYFLAHEAVLVPEAEELEERASVGDQAEGYLQQKSGELREMGFRTQIQVLGGDVASAICDAATAQAADLIAMTTHGRSGLARWALGSVADRVIREAQQPIFLVRGTVDIPPRDKIQRILVPLDGSDLSEAALPHAEALAKAKDAELILLRVVDRLSDLEVAEVYASWESADKVYERRFEWARRYLLQVQQDLRSDGVLSEIEVNEGHPAEIILKTADDFDVDLITMSTHGRSGMARWVYGSVTDKVLRRATHPLLLIRARPERKERSAGK